MQSDANANSNDPDASTLKSSDTTRRMRVDRYIDCIEARQEYASFAPV